mmetsp:Transcript_7385/g.22499  ORF Transcript_7385/g.22499 Transcript_7385/m.22499 type:complete len:113 (+) Transcript_7385:254-592(+)|eukprot:CAMPEP_0198729766 /NCGR_PEP_ID=MMETSP1475-20131203/20904_1 /TAXON_ID= ORGANISM="Unidentified sp., Strain CCMP1999" /NCGR_SAMPLE_ID=MMETSP1475 /ASSEMBLY_ACC=CAM_ASM_001111 /LENGTH=112 /DNA_ID=CAMNT_0044492469 /DNA_START=78 /DNA_END=416 /DNA_ORIENTATION=+
MSEQTRRANLANDFLRARERGEMQAALAMCSDMMMIVTDSDGDLFGRDCIEEYVQKGRGKRIDYLSGFEYDERKKVLSVEATETHLKMIKRKKRFEFCFDDQRIRVLFVRSV